MRIEQVEISQINPAPYNPRKDLKPEDSEYKKLARSLDEFGCVEPLVWNKRSGNLVGGHQRLKILIDRGVTETAVSVVDLPPEREKALNIALNKIQGDWDDDKLAELLEELAGLPDFDIELTGFELPDAEELIAEHLKSDPEDEAFDLEAELERQGPVITQPGDLLELGRHRLLCGDSTNVKDVRKLMDGKRAILFATDPPYLVGYDGTNHPGKTSQRRVKLKSNKDWSKNCGFTWDDPDANPELYERFIKAAVEEAIRPNAAWYCWHASRRQVMVEEAWAKAGAFVHQQIIWVKDRPILSRSWYTWQHEPCFFGWVRPNKPPRRTDKHLSSIWQLPTVPVGQKNEHPTSKPVEVFAIPMRQHTRRGAICYEPFCGSGSQLIAAEKLGRRCYAIEISGRYCDLIVRRWISFVGRDKAPTELVERYRTETHKEVIS